MTSPTTFQSQLLSKPGRRPRRGAEEEDIGKKPKKVNSEVRKQQNRIASRNYREKRKRKLQYLQQLIKDGSNDEETPEPSPQQREAHLRSHSAEHNAGHSSSPFMVPSSSDFASLSSSNTAALCATTRASVPVYEGHLLPTAQSYSPFATSWATQLFTPPPPDVAYTPSWMSSSIDYGSRLAPRHENYHFSPHTGQAVFEPATSPYHHPREVLPNADAYVLGSPYAHYHGLHRQASSTPSVSLPNSSSYFQGHYPGPH